MSLTTSRSSNGDTPRTSLKTKRKKRKRKKKRRRKLILNLSLPSGNSLSPSATSSARVIPARA
jgi:hypothetical protein